ncbi:hypothetical protein PENTCL1PPCAC_19318, partial [Pristionchus entomophagus]
VQNGESFFSTHHGRPRHSGASTLLRQRRQLLRGRSSRSLGCLPCGASALLRLILRSRLIRARNSRSLLSPFSPSSVGSSFERTPTRGAAITSKSSSSSSSSIFTIWPVSIALSIESFSSTLLFFTGSFSFSSSSSFFISSPPLFVPPPTPIDVLSSPFMIGCRVAIAAAAAVATSLVSAFCGIEASGSSTFWIRSTNCTGPWGLTGLFWTGAGTRICPVMVSRSLEMEKI